MSYLQGVLQFPPTSRTSTQFFFFQKSISSSHPTFGPIPFPTAQIIIPDLHLLFLAHPITAPNSQSHILPPAIASYPTPSPTSQGQPRMHPRVRIETVPSGLGQATDPNYVRVRGIYFQGFGDEIWVSCAGKRNSDVAGFLWRRGSWRVDVVRGDGDEHDDGSGRSEYRQGKICE
jgi:hypothetical protein